MRALATVTKSESLIISEKEACLGLGAVIAE